MRSRTLYSERAPVHDTAQHRHRPALANQISRQILVVAEFRAFDPAYGADASIDERGHFAAGDELICGLEVQRQRGSGTAFRRGKPGTAVDSSVREIDAV